MRSGKRLARRFPEPDPPGPLLRSATDLCRGPPLSRTSPSRPRISGETCSWSYSGCSFGQAHDLLSASELSSTALSFSSVTWP
ncbi:hypothetical protein Pden_4532 (plasmid) [Paracoccus denitrificans PD1222]|uniref:Uncharacterized protein n=1 Tax=Paracoccus denitrificans (strain Pd 1222) TaxID=318586 RepID=A1BAQ2_PARDP|nr:hypothetical protein Pden_4532 [Paracoccus denitrificans PD1222]